MNPLPKKSCRKLRIICRHREPHAVQDRHRALQLHRLQCARVEKHVASGSTQGSPGPGRSAGNSQRQAKGMGGAALLATAARVGQVRDALSQIVRAQGAAQEDSTGRAEQSSEGVDGGHSQSEQGLAEAGGRKRWRTVAGAGSGEAVAGSSQEATGSSAMAQAASRSSRAASRSLSNTSTSLRASTVRDGSQQGDDNG